MNPSANNPHLSEEALDDLLIGMGSSEAEAHLAACASCRARAEAFQADMALLGQTSLAWSRIHAAALPVPQKTGTGTMPFGKIYWALAVVLLLVISLPVLDHRNKTLPRPVTPGTAQNEDNEQQIAQDNDLMHAVDAAINPNETSPVHTYHLSDQSHSRQKARLDEN